LGDKLNSRESNRLTAEEKKLVDELVAQLGSVKRDTAQRLATRFVRHGSKILRGRRVRMEGFQGRLYSRWAVPLDFYELCLYIAQNSGDFFNRKFHPKSVTKNDHQFEVLVRLQAGAVRVAGEIYTLLLAGYASGAHARWRTLHEIAVTALFIGQEGKKTAERYVDHRFVKSYEDALEYQKHAEKLNVKPLPNEEFERIKRDYEGVLAHHGEGFRHSYGWATPALVRRDPKLNGAKIGFAHLQSAVNTRHWTPYHRMASHAVHPSATFIRFNLGSREDVPVILAGPSNADLAEAGQGAVLSLTNATAALLTYNPPPAISHLRDQVGLSAMVTTLSAVSTLAIREFLKVHEQLEREMVAEREKPPNISGRAVRPAENT
jgi:hypothetical protein